jgi:hypothetical protein
LPAALGRAARAGLVRVAVPRGVHPIFEGLTEAYDALPETRAPTGRGAREFFLCLQEVLGRAVLGPDWRHPETDRRVHETVGSGRLLVIDADGLNARPRPIPRGPAAPPSSRLGRYHIGFDPLALPTAEGRALCRSHGAGSSEGGADRGVRPDGEILLSMTGNPG